MGHSFIHSSLFHTIRHTQKNMHLATKDKTQYNNDNNYNEYTTTTHTTTALIVLATIMYYA